jgi:hypothetical protein
MLDDHLIVLVVGADYSELGMLLTAAVVIGFAAPMITIAIARVFRIGYA